MLAFSFRRIRLLALIVPAAAFGAGVPRDLRGTVEVTAANEVSNLDRRTGRVISKIDITLANRGTATVEGPLHAVVGFSGDGDLSQVTVSGALGGRGQAPYQAHYLDLSGQIGAGIAPGGSTAFRLEFSRPSALKVLYQVSPHGVANRAPVAAFEAPAEVTRGLEAVFDGGASTDPDGDELTYEWEFGEGATAQGVAPRHGFAAPGVFDVRLRVKDPKGLECSVQRSVLVAPDGDFALVRTRTLDECGVPLGGVAVERLDAPGGGSSDPDDGYLVLGGEPGLYAWRFSKAGHLPVWREALLPNRQVLLLPSPWLTPVAEPGAAVSPLNAANLGGPGHPAEVSFPAGAFPAPGTAVLTPLHGQSLPFPLPVGWSPLAALHLGGPGQELLEPGAATWNPADAVRAGDLLAVVNFDEASRRWIVTDLPVAGGSVTSPLRSYGWHALVVADEARPPAPVAGAPLEGVAVPGSEPVTAEGSTDPASRTASLDPALVKTTARVLFTAASAQASGRVFRTDIAENYLFAGGGSFRPADRDATFFAYQRPGDANPNTLEAVFPMRPARLFSPVDLDRADLKADVFDSGDFRSAVFGPEGGVMVLDKTRIAAPAGQLARRTAVELRTLDAAAFHGLLGGLEGVVFLQLSFTGGAPLEPAFALGLADCDFVLARVLTKGGQQGLEPLLRMHSGSDGVARASEPATEPRLPGLTSGGTLVLVKLESPQGVVAGVARGLDGQPKQGLLVRIEGQPWLTASAAGGGWKLLAPAGAGKVLLFDPADGNGGEAGFALGDPAVGAAADVRSRPTGPRVVSITPADGATKVSAVTPVVVVFSEAIAPASLGADGVTISKQGETTAVPAAVSLGTAGTVVSLFPSTPLEAGASYRVRISNSITDKSGLPVEGSLESTFSVRPPENRGAGGQLVIYEPGGAGPTPADRALIDAIPGYEPGSDGGKVAAVGSPGTADPAVPVILVNETTGATATVLSKPDGSFANFIEAAEEDFISAVFVNANGTRVTIPASKQKFDDGRVGLYRQGGILEAESDGGAVQVIVEPEAVATRTVFAVEAVPPAELREILNDTEPEEGGKVLGGLRYGEQGDPIAIAADVSFPLKPGDLPDGVDPLNATFVLAMPLLIDGVTTFQVLDAMTFVPDGGAGRLETRSPPFIGLLLRQINAMRREAGFTDTLNRVASAGFGSAAAQHSSVGSILVPMLVAPVVGQKVAGKVVTLRSGEQLADTEGLPLPGAFVRLEVGIGALDQGAPGLFRRGETFSMSDRDGRFAFHMPTSFNRRLVATHPRFPFQRAASTGIAAGELVARTVLIFRQPAPVSADIEDTAAPLISISQSPLAATSGQGANDGAVLTITAADDIEVASITVERDAFLGTGSGQIRDISRLLPPVLLEGEIRPSPGRLQARYRMQAAEKATAIYRIHAVDPAGNLTTERHVVVFGDPAPGGGQAATRRLSNAWPPDGATGQLLGTPIRLRFSVPLAEADITDLSWIQLGPSGDFSLAGVEPSVDRRELVVRYFVNSTAARELTINFGTDRVNQALVGTSSGPVATTYRIGFAEPPSLSVQDSTLASGAGVVMMGQFVYSLDRDGTGGSLRVHELKSDGSLVLVQTEPIPERPSDLVAIPAYPLREFDGSVTPAAPYLAIFSGGALDIKQLRLYRIQPDGRVSRAFTKLSPVSLAVSQVSKAKWDPPFLAFQEITSEGTSISLLNLNAFSIGHRLKETMSNAELRAALPLNGRPGIDLNNDGDFADDGETAPLPASRDGQVFGLEFSWGPLNPDERLRDFDFSADFGLLGGVFGGPAGQGLIMVLGGGAPLDEATARVTFPEDPKRVSFLPRLPLRVGGVEQVTDVALISTVATADGSAPLLVADITNPAAPRLLGRAILPAGTGSLNTVVQRDDGLIALSTTLGGILLLDPRFLLEARADGLTAALLRNVPGLAGGGERSFAADVSGLGFTANGQGLRAAYGGPQIDVVTFDHAPFDTAKWKGGSVGTGATREEKMASVLAGARRVGSGLVFPAADGAPADDRRNHFYVVVRAPGAMGPELELAAAAVDAAGRPTLPNKRLAAPTFLGHESLTLRFIALAAFNAFKTLDFTADSTALIDSLVDMGIEEAFNHLILQQGQKPSYASGLVAHRLSDNPTHPLYNSYLSGPIVLLSQDLTKSRHDALKAGLDRRFLAATAGMWVGLSPLLGESSMLHPFASRQDESLEISFNAGMNLRTLIQSARIAFHLFFGNKLEAVRLAIQFIDLTLVRTLQPGVNAYVHVGHQRNPLVFIPGIMGSELRVNGDGKKLWVDISDVLTSDVAKLNLGPDGRPSPPGEQVGASQVVTYVAGSDMAGSMLEFLVGDLDYRQYEFRSFEGFNQEGLNPPADVVKKNPDLFPFPYDWRQNNVESAAKLARYVELIRAMHPEADNVDIVAHSMGGLVSRRFMLDHPGVVGKLVLVASPLLGASKAVFAKKEGDLDDFMINLLVGADTGKLICRHMAGLDQLMPSQAAFRLGFRPVWEHGVDLDGDGFAFGSLNYPAYRSFLDNTLYPALPAPRPTPIGGNNELLHGVEGQDDWRSDTTGTQLFHLVGVQTLPKTITHLRVRPRLKPVAAADARDVLLSAPPVAFTDTDEIQGGLPRLPEDGEAAFPVDNKAYRLDYDLELVRGAGDGTVPLLCAARGYGAGDGFDLNPSRMRVIPVVSQDTGSSANKGVGHVPVLVNPITKRWVGRILSEQFQDSEVPVVTIAGAGEIAEGATDTLTATVSRPAGVEGEPVFTWDLGDGRILRGSSVPVGYADEGEYVVSCVARFPGAEELSGTKGVAGLDSHVVRVTNRPPAPVLTVNPENPAPGQAVRFRVNPGDPSPTDSFTYSWTTGDNPSAAPIEGSSPVLRHSYTQPGSYTLTVKVRDDDGAEAIVTKSVTVAATSPIRPLRSPPPASPATDKNPFDNNPAGGLQYARIFCTGVDSSEDLVRVNHDQRRVIGNVDGSVVRDDGGNADTIAGGSVQIDIYREVAAGPLPQESRLLVRATGESVAFRVEYFPGDGRSRCFFHTCATDQGDDVTLTLAWDNLIDLAEGSVAAMTIPVATTAGSTPGCNRAEFYVDNLFDEGPSEVSLDMVGIDQEPVADVAADPTPTYVDDGPATAGTDPCRDLDQRLFRRMTARSAHAATAPGGAAYSVGELPGGGAAAVNGTPAGHTAATITEEQADDVRAAVKVVFTSASALGAESPDNVAASIFNRFVLSLNDLLILEQGTGAVLWKGAAALRNGAYVRGSSDNDYELFFPAFKSADRALDPDDAQHRQMFPQIAHTEDMMQGDWYFLPPRGYAENGRGGFEDLGPLPDFRSAAYREYLSEVTHWGYALPREADPDEPNARKVLKPRIGDVAAWSGLGGVFVGLDSDRLLMRKGAVLFGEDPEKSPFHHPLTPAQIVSYALTKSVTTTNIVRGELTDVSFFPFRREHFLFAVMSLEKPPPFGDDPIGDAGMGRGLLLLKWLLEGAFLPPFAGFNQGVDDLALRGRIHERLVERASTLVPEAFEWALYQEFALLGESGDLRVRPANAEAAADRERCRLVFGDFISAHDDKIMKKAGKAAIRAALGRLIMDPVARGEVLATTPQDYANENFRSFEHFIEARVRSRLGLFSNHGPGGTALTATDFRHILGAKSGNKPTFGEIRLAPDGVDGFLLKCFSLLNQIQRDTADGYLDFLDELADRRAFAERLARTRNAAAVQHGFTPPGGETRPGRLAMHGIPGAGDHEAHWSFIINLRNHSGSEVGPLAIEINGTKVCEGIVLEADDTSLVVPNKKRGYCASQEAIEGLTYHRDVARRGFEPLTVRVTGIPPGSNKNVDNDSLLLEAGFLDIDAFIGPDFRFAEIQVEGLVKSPFVAGRLAEYEHHARFRVVDFDGKVIPGATVRMEYVDPTDGLIDEVRADKTVPLTRGVNLVFGNIPEFTVYGVDGEGRQTANRLAFATDLSVVYQDFHLRPPTEPEANMLRALRVPVAGETDDERESNQLNAALALLPHARKGFSGLTSGLPVADLEEALLRMGVVFGGNVEARMLIGKFLVLNPTGAFDERVYLPATDPEDPDEAPGHNPGRADAVTGIIVIHEDLLDQARAGNRIRIQRPDGTLVDDGGATSLLPEDWIRAEALHELDTRFVRAVYGIGGTGLTNQFVDTFTSQLDFPELLPFRTVNGN